MELVHITTAIVCGNFSNDDLDKIANAIRFARGRLTKDAVGQFVIGTKVKFVNRNKQTVYGEVSKVNRKYIIVNTGTTSWRVPGNMLTAA